MIAILWIRDWFRKYNAIIFGILLGICIMFIIQISYRTYIAPTVVTNSYVTNKLDSNLFSKKTAISTINQNIIDLKLSDKNIEEKIASTNKRLDDLLLFGGMIITLLLAVTVSVYFKTESQVKKLFVESFKIYEEQAFESIQAIDRIKEEYLVELDFLKQAGRQATELTALPIE